jgi:superfamily II DNA/RNA helicase
MIKTSNPFENALIRLGIKELNDMQIKSLAAHRNNNNIVLISPTGTGKTLAFLLPLLETLKENLNEVQVLIITPSRELAQQIEIVFRKMGTSFKAISCYGGHSKRTEKNNFILPPAVLIGTPGRLSDHIRSGNFSVVSVNTIILDEFDKSLELGFQEEMSFIIGQLISVKKRILCSATDLVEIPKFTGIGEPIKLNYLLEKSNSNALTVNIIKSDNKDKLNSLFNLLCNLGSGSTLVFCNHREAVERISQHLSQLGIINDYFHGGLEQAERERMLVRFRNGSSNILITTDLASRGLDIPDIQYIIHYQLPGSEEAYIHRNGRTARMNSTGSSFLIFSADEKIPSFINSGYINFELIRGMSLPTAPLWQTLYFGGGKKDKINKMDIAGFLFKQGGLKKHELGFIDVKDHHSYAAIKNELIRSVLQKVKGQKIKNMKVKIEISY